MEGAFSDVTVTILCNRAMLAFNTNRFEEARQYFDQALALARQEESTSLIVMVLANRAFLLMVQGELVAARCALVEVSTLGAKNYHLSGSFATLDLLEGNLPSARQGYQQMLSQIHEIQVYQDNAYTLTSLGMLALREGNPRKAAQLFGASLAWDERSGRLIEQSRAWLSREKSGAASSRSRRERARGSAC